MRLSNCYWIGAAALLFLAACAPSVARWRSDAVNVAARVTAAEGHTLFPEEYNDLERALNQGELFFKEGEAEKADTYYLLTISKGKMLQESIAVEKQRRETARREEELRLQEEAKRRAEELAREQLLAREAEARQQAEAEAAANERRRVERARPPKPLPSSHTVKRGETLPQIAAQSEIYGDPNLWPLLYRANRDQIRDPRIIWPGQVLRVPRNVGRDEQAEARRYSQEKPLR